MSFANQWAHTFADYITAMTRGNGYGGERFWDEEEKFLRQFFAGRYIGRSLSMGCGLFRELETLRDITTSEVWGMDVDQRFVEYTQVLQTNVKPAVRIVSADLYTVSIHPRERFDLVVMLYNSFGTLPDMHAALRRLFDAVLPGGTLLLSFWLDDDVTTDERCRIYTSMGDKQASIELSPTHGLFDIVVFKACIEVFRSSLVTKAFLQNLVGDELPGCRVEFSELSIVRIVMIHKSPNAV